MSNFLCEHCGTEIIDSEQGYITGCEHYKADVSRNLLTKDCQVYTGKCSCPDGQPICVPR